MDIQITIIADYILSGYRVEPLTPWPPLPPTAPPTLALWPWPWLRLPCFLVCLSFVAAAGGGGGISSSSPVPSSVLWLGSII